MSDSKTEMTQDAASRIQSANAQSGGDMSYSGFPARAQSAAATNANEGGGGGAQGGADLQDGGDQK